MVTNYILFIHGVNTRNTREQPTYADELFDLIQKNVSSSISLKKVALYWGDVTLQQENELREGFKQSKSWDKLWFKDFREKQLLQFVGDAALYLSRHVGSLAVEQLTQQAKQGLEGYQPGDCLHLVTHSWGTVILFDVLFANRWNDPEIPGYKSIQEIRKDIFGLLPDSKHGIPLVSVHTMGSPIALFSLITIIGRDRQGSTHDISPGLKELLKNLHERGIKLPWQNYIHPGDPIAWPLEKLIPSLVDECQKFINIEDIITSGSGPLDFLGKMLQKTFLSLVNGGSAHGSYLKSKEVAKKIAQTIQESANKFSEPKT